MNPPAFHSQTQVAKFAEAGIYTVFDMHQDCLWEHGADDDAGSGYWGVPPWIKREVPPVDNFPYPFEAFSGWFCAYFTEEVSKGFQVDACIATCLSIYSSLHRNSGYIR